MADFKPLINKGYFTSEGGLKDSELVQRAFIDEYLPFLPLEQSHVKKCIVQYLQDFRNFTSPYIKPGKDVIEKIANMNEYIDDAKVYSRFGCRRVKNIADTELLSL